MINEKCCCCPTYPRSENNVRYWSSSQETMYTYWSRGTDNGYSHPVVYSDDKTQVLCGDGSGIRFWLLDTATGGALAAFDVFPYLNALSNQIDTALLMSDWVFFQHDDGVNVNTMTFSLDGTEITRTQSFTDAVVGCYGQGSQYLYTLESGQYYAYDSQLNQVAALGSIADRVDECQTSAGLYVVEQESDGGGGFAASTASLRTTSGVTWQQNFVENYSNPLGSLGSVFATTLERNVAGNVHLIVRNSVFVNMTTSGFHEYSIPELSSWIIPDESSTSDQNKSLVWVNDTDFTVYKEAFTLPFGGGSFYARLAYYSAGTESWNVEVVSDSYVRGILAIFSDSQRTITQLNASAGSSRASTVHDNSDGSVLYTIPFNDRFVPKPWPDCLTCVATPDFHGVIRSGSYSSP